MIPKKIEKKLKEKCGSDTAAFESIMQLLENLDRNGKKGATQNAVAAVEQYYKEADKYED